MGIAEVRKYARLATRHENFQGLLLTARSKSLIKVVVHFHNPKRYSMVTIWLSIGTEPQKRTIAGSQLHGGIK